MLNNALHDAGIYNEKKLLIIDLVTTGTRSRAGITKVSTIRGSMCEKFRKVIVK